MGYIMYAGVYLTTTTMIGFMPYNASETIEGAKEFSKNTFDGFSKTYHDAIFIPIK